MDTITLLLADEHPLIQVGFRGRLRLGEGVDVQVAGPSGGPSRRRALPSHKRRALLLLASGCGPIELAGRLGLCLERAEAMHEELSRTLGLDRIARQVRSAMRAGALGALPSDEATGDGPAGIPDSMGDRMMEDLDLVRSLFPQAQALRLEDGSWAVVVDPAGDEHRLGDGRSSSEAWASAASRLTLDEWFRPIIAQLRAMRSGRGSGA